MLPPTILWIALAVGVMFGVVVGRGFHFRYPSSMVVGAFGSLPPPRCVSRVLACVVMGCGDGLWW